MSNITKTMMSLELEFIEPTAHGFINWVDSVGNSLATLGLGSTAIIVDGEGNETSTGGVRYLEWNLVNVDFIKITGGGIQFDEQRSLSINSIRPVYDQYDQLTGEEEDYISSQIHLNNANYKDETIFEPANIIYTEGLRFNELKKIKAAYVSKTNAMILEHENTIAFSNPVSKRLLGQIDTINEVFVWYGSFSLGSVVDDSYFEIKRVDSKYNLTLNAATNKNPEIGFKYEDVMMWVINVSTNNLHLKDMSGHGIELKNNNSVLFTGEIIYNNTTLPEYFYTQSVLDDGVLDARYYTKTQLDGGQLDNRYYTKTDVYTKTQMQTSGSSQLHWGNITSKPTTISGFGITDTYTKTQMQTSGSSQLHWDNITSKPTTYPPNTHTHDVIIPFVSQLPQNPLNGYICYMYNSFYNRLTLHIYHNGWRDVSFN